MAEARPGPVDRGFVHVARRPAEQGERRVPLGPAGLGGRELAGDYTRAPVGRVGEQERRHGHARRQQERFGGAFDLGQPLALGGEPVRDREHIEPRGVHQRAQHAGQRARLPAGREPLEPPPVRRLPGRARRQASRRP